MLGSLKERGDELQLVSMELLWERIRSLPSPSVIVTDAHVETLYRHELRSLDVMVVPPGEASKTRATKEQLEDQLLKKGYGRDLTLVGLGGGVITDLTGFLAATYMRGVPLILVPTTLLGMVDAAIGGKNGVNTPHGKNMIGTIYMPENVISSEEFLKTLPEKERKNGLVEMIKMSLIDGRYNPKGPLSLQSAAQFKLHFVRGDRYERRGLRRALNLGHTVGHAIERITNYKIPHGEAVALGIMAESTLSLSNEDVERVESIFRDFEIPLSLPSDCDQSSLKAALLFDKKAVGGAARFVMLEKIGHVSPFDGEYCQSISPARIDEMLSWLFKRYQCETAPY